MRRATADYESQLPLARTCRVREPVPRDVRARERRQLEVMEAQCMRLIVSALWK